MKKEIKEKFPSWCMEDSSKYELMISDDIDSLMCYIFQNRVFNRECRFFIDANYKKCTMWNYGIQRLYGTENCTNKKENLIALDFAIDRKNTKCWDNHVIKISEDDAINPLSANLNIPLDISLSNYTDKACISSFITMLSYYNIDIEKWDKDMLSILCAIDGVYHPFTSSNPKFNRIGKHNLELLEYGFLVDFIKENTTYIKKVEQNLNLKNGKIWINKESGLLETNIKLEKLSDIFGIDIELPGDIFYIMSDIKSKYITENEIKSKKVKSKEDLKSNGKIFNLVMTSAKYGVASYL